MHHQWELSHVELNVQPLLEKYLTLFRKLIAILNPLVCKTLVDGITNPAHHRISDVATAIITPKVLTIIFWNLVYPLQKFFSFVVRFKLQLLGQDRRNC